MALDLTRIAAQVEGMVARLKASSEQLQQKLRKALDTLGQATDLDLLKRKVARGKTSWLVADPVDGLDQRYAAQPTPAEFSVAASDGSQIDVDRHQQARYYLINIGCAVLGYGSNPEAALDSYPRLCSDDEDLFMAPPGGGGRAQPVEGALLGIKRSVEEYRHLARIMAGLPPAMPALGLIDGSLILWGLVSQDYPEFVVEALLEQGFIRYLDDIRGLSRERRLAVASYISFPRSTDVVNTLRVAICPHDVPNCDRYCADITWGKRECDAVAGVQDRELFSGLLADGERSALFISRSSIVQKRYGSHRVYFCYLKVGDEIARVEIPQWVAMDEERLELAHALVLDQCRRGHGYPVALSEAHQQAVITGADRINFQHLVEMLMAEEKIAVTTSAKSQSKRTRWV
jgi:hypothetical protein